MANTKSTNGQAVDFTIHAADRARRKLCEVYKAQQKRDVSISPLYKPYLGNVLTRSLNGIFIAVPVDGSHHEVPESFADDIDSVIMAIDASIKKATKMSDVHANVERYPGELPMF